MFKAWLSGFITHEMKISSSSCKNVLLAYFWDLWRKEWATASPSSSLTKVFFPTVESVNILPFIELPHQLVQFFSCHNRLQIFLFRIKAAESNLCRCAEVETTDHFLFFCPISNVQCIPFKNLCLSFIKTWLSPLHRLICDISSIKKRKTIGH